MPLRSIEQFIGEGSKVFHRQAPNRDASRGWLRIAERLMRDSRNAKNSNETRLTAAYDSILNFALVVVSARGYRVTSADGHHAQTLEAACACIGAGTGLLDRIDAVRIVRNEKYAGIEVKDADVAAAAKALSEFTALCADWLKRTHPGFP
jgi:hypothetical protein